MLQTLTDVIGRSLHARDGEIGEVKDVYFDDRHWHVRYLVVETGTWLNKRRVLISPVALGPLEGSRQAIPADLTREQVRTSPSADTDRPVSRQHEDALHQHFGWTPYWGAMFAEGAIVPPFGTPNSAAQSSPEHDPVGKGASAPKATRFCAARTTR